VATTGRREFLISKGMAPSGGAGRPVWLLRSRPARAIPPRGVHSGWRAVQRQRPGL